MILTFSEFNTLPQQVQENKEAIKILADYLEKNSATGMGIKSITQDNGVAVADGTRYTLTFVIGNEYTTPEEDAANTHSFSYVAKTGATGATGARGQGFNWRGSYSALATYEAYDVVSTGTGTWVARQHVPENTRPSGASSYWDLWTTNGINGINGTNGTNGKDGTSFVWKGAWNMNTQYNANDVVQYLGSAYICLVDGTNNVAPAGNSNNWGLMCSMGEKGSPGQHGRDGQGFNYQGAWVGSTPPAEHHPYDVVTYNGNAYICTLAVNSNTPPPSDTTHWDLFAGGHSGSADTPHLYRHIITSSGETLNNNQRVDISLMLYLTTPTPLTLWTEISASLQATRVRIPVSGFVIDNNQYYTASFYQNLAGDCFIDAYRPILGDSPTNSLGEVETKRIALYDLFLGENYVAMVDNVMQLF